MLQFEAKYDFQLQSKSSSQNNQHCLFQLQYIDISLAMAVFPVRSNQTM